MKEKYLVIFVICISMVGTLFTNSMKDVQCALEKAVDKSDLEGVTKALKKGARADRPVTCIKGFEGKKIQDLADKRVEKAKNKEKADKVRDRISRAIGKERSGS